MAAATPAVDRAGADVAVTSFVGEPSSGSCVHPIGFLTYRPAKVEQTTNSV